MEPVIQFPAVTPFKLREIVGGRGGVITDWLSSRTEARAAFRVRVNNLRKVPRVQWTKNEFRYLGSGLWEIKWKPSNVPYRALGFDSGGYFILVIGCTHKMKAYDPRSCIKTAKKLKREVENGQWGTADFEP
jgi:hypothetical protein